jgi:hypothetical protein
MSPALLVGASTSARHVAQASRVETRFPAPHQTCIARTPLSYVDAEKRPLRMTEPIPAWQCIGCGRIEAPQTCIGVCQDRRVELVYASEHAETEAELAAVRSALEAAERARDATLAKLATTVRERDALDAVTRRLAFSRPRSGEWERSYRALQAQARDALRATSESQTMHGERATDAAA